MRGRAARRQYGCSREARPKGCHRHSRPLTPAEHTYTSPTFVRRDRRRPPAHETARGPKRLVARFEPHRALDVDRVVRLRFVAHVAMDDVEESVFFHVVYTPAVAEPARFTGTFTDAVVEGSLAVDVGVNVRQAGWYLIDANLHDERGEPVAWSRFKGDLAAGPATARLVFFGRILREHGVRGAFSLRALRGSRFVEATDPQEERMVPLDVAHQTAVYSVEAFSSAPWDSAEKRRKIARLRAD